MKPATRTPTALLLIDIQQGFDHPAYCGRPRNNPEFEANVSSIINTFRVFQSQNKSRSTHVIHVHHHSEQPDSKLHPTSTFKIPGTDSPIRGIDPQPYAAPLPSEPVFAKSVNSSFIGTKLEPYLRENGIRQLVIVGLTTDHCVSTTTRMAANLKVLGDDGGVDGSGPGSHDHGLLLVSDATATFGRGEYSAEMLHGVHLTSLNEEFCKVVTTAEVLEKVLGV